MVPTTLLFIFILLNSHQVALETVIIRTYYNTELSWSDAKDFCFNQSSILEMNYTDTITSSENITAQLWTGSYTTWSDWAVIWGCYKSPQTVSATFEDSKNEKYFCQQYCQSSQYFAFEDGACYCLDVIGSPVSHSYCQTPRQTTSYVVVYKQNIPGVQRTLDDTPEDQLRCMSAQCQDGEIILRSENCNSYYEGICESGLNNGSYTTQQSAATLCDNADSFLQWYNNKSFCETGKTNQLWTSATRDIYSRDLTTNDQTSSINPMMCQYMDVRNSSTAFGNCTDRRTFICRFEKIVLPSGTGESNNIIGLSMYGLMGFISLMIVIIIIVVGHKTSNTNKRKKDEVKEPVTTTNKRSYSVQITELQSPLEDIIEDSETSYEQSRDGRNNFDTVNASVLVVQTSLNNDKSNKRLTSFKRGSPQFLEKKLKEEIGNITAGKAEETIDNDESISNICHTKTQTEQSILNSNTNNVAPHPLGYTSSIISRSDHEDKENKHDHYDPNNDFKKQYQPNKPTTTINQDSKTDTGNNKCPELALNIDFGDIKDPEDFSIPARDITDVLSGNIDDIDDSKDVPNSSRRQIDFKDELTGEYNDIEVPEDASHASRRQIDFTNELTGYYADIEESEDELNSFRRQVDFTNELTDDIRDSEDVTHDSRRPFDFTKVLTCDYDDIDDTSEMSIPIQTTHVFSSERIPDYDEIDDRKDPLNPNEEKHIFTNELSLDGMYDGIDETTNDMVPSDNASKFTFNAEKDKKLSIDQFDDYDEIEDSSDAMYATTEPYIVMSHGSIATTEKYMDMSQGSRRTQLSNSEGSSTTNTNSNNPSSRKITNEPIYAISTKKSIKIKSKESDLVTEALSHSECITTTNTDSNNPSSSITNEPIYAVSTKRSIKIKSNESDLVTEPVYAIPSKKSRKMKSRDPGFFSIKDKTENQTETIQDAFYDQLHENRLEKNDDQSLYVIYRHKIQFIGNESRSIILHTQVYKITRYYDRW
ncbi:unnamed protein product [Mytilus coruscus]|uniref:C-type lectin domain-containing protein n=1 Tax=Mytilus coruscus TaxID=42192 RepID=A0A6J8DBT6_MYTCO|nr:unnamed protein product [Mytilus coruscus]